MNHSWKNLPITRKLLILVGAIVTLLGLQILTLRYAVSHFSAMRDLIETASQWNDNQKTAIIELYQFALTQDEDHLENFRKNLSHANQQFLNIHQNLAKIPLNQDSSQIWKRGRQLESEFTSLAQQLEANKISDSSQELAFFLQRMKGLNSEFTSLQKNFFSQIDKNSQSLDATLSILLISVMLTAGALALWLTCRLVRHFNQNIEEIKSVSAQVGQGDFTKKISVDSQDEMGQVAKQLNQMIENLQNTMGEKVKAENANQIKTLFLANMSHEIRTPLGVIMGLTEVLKDPSLPEAERLKYLEVIDQTGRSLEHLISDILDISKVETGHLKTKKTSFKIQDFIDELQLNLQLIAKRGGNKLRFEMKSGSPSFLKTDRFRLRQILLNLIGNSLKFTQNGEVTVQISTHEDRIFFSVKDTGTGIPLSQQDKLFQPFSQIESPSQKSPKGTGLGLLLSKRLAQILGGDIHLKFSSPSQGSEFVVTLPISASNRKPVSLKKVSTKKNRDGSKKLNGKHILLVEDAPDVQMLLQLFLNKKGVKVDLANNGQEGLDKANHHQYDLILMDMQMPLLDGYATTEALRKSGNETPIVALTARAMKEDRDRCLKVGCNDYMTKPIDPPSFFSTISAHIS